MEEADRIMCEKCMAVNYADAEFCRRCGEPLPQNASTPTPQEADISSYSASDELPEPPRNALDELMHLGFGGSSDLAYGLDLFSQSLKLLHL